MFGVQVFVDRRADVLRAGREVYFGDKAVFRVILVRYSSLLFFFFFFFLAGIINAVVKEGEAETNFFFSFKFQKLKRIIIIIIIIIFDGLTIEYNIDKNNFQIPLLLTIQFSCWNNNIVKEGEA